MLFCRFQGFLKILKSNPSPIRVLSPNSQQITGSPDCVYHQKSIVDLVKLLKQMHNEVTGNSDTSTDLYVYIYI